MLRFTFIFGELGYPAGNSNSNEIFEFVFIKYFFWFIFLNKSINNKLKKKKKHAEIFLFSLANWTISQTGKSCFLLIN